MKTLTCASVFTGFGGWELGAIRHGLKPMWGVEYNPKPDKLKFSMATADAYERNIGAHIVRRPAQEVNFSSLERVDFLFASPPCTTASVANKASAGETADDLAMAGAVIRAIQVLRPRYFFLENVRQYQTYQGFKNITKTLEELGYWFDAQVYQVADYGVPQTRARLVLRAELGGFWSMPFPAKASRRIGWYKAIEDLIPTLPESQFAPWQLKRLGLMAEALSGNQSVLLEGANSGQDRGKGYRLASEPAGTTLTSQTPGKYRALLLASQNASNEVITPRDDLPAFTVTSSSFPSKAYLVDCQNNGQPDETGLRGLTIRQEDEPCYTVASSASHRVARPSLPDGKVVQLNARALARFQTLPDWYGLPEKATHACYGIGNMIPVRFVEALLEPFVLKTLEDEFR